MTRLHLAESAEPLVQGSTVRALCGDEVRFAAAVRISDSDESAMSNCRRCNRSPEMRERYQYVIQNAQEAKLEGND